MTSSDENAGVNFEQLVAARRSIRSFEDRPVPREAVTRAIELAVQAPAPHHSAPWRFALIEEPLAKEAFSAAMGDAWRTDLEADRLPPEKIEGILSRSYELLTQAPLLIVACADMTLSHDYPDERRRRAEWSLFAHSTGAALQTLMLSLAEDSIGSCWISAPVFCGEVVKEHLGLDGSVEPQALVLAGYPSGAYEPRSRPAAEARNFIVADW